MRTSTIVWTIIILIILVGGWYIWMQSSVPAPLPTTNQPAATSTATSTVSTTSTTTPTGDGTPVSENLILGINAGSGDVTDFLSAYNGMTVYTYSPDSDTPGQSSCTGSCATNWPPYTVSSASDINVPASISGQVGTITRADGTLQVTYNGAPLYFYAQDTNPGDVNGEGVGGVWYVVHP